MVSQYILLVAIILCHAVQSHRLLQTSCKIGYLPRSETKGCQLNGYTCLINLDGPRCCDGRQKESRKCIPCDETRLKKPSGSRYTTANTCAFEKAQFEMEPTKRTRECDWNGADKAGRFSLGGGGHTLIACLDQCKNDPNCKFSAFSSIGYCHNFRTCDGKDGPGNWKVYEKTSKASNMCDWRCYLDRYPDLQKAFGGDLARASSHYTTNGKREGRDCSCPKQKFIQVKGEGTCESLGGHATIMDAATCEAAAEFLGKKDTSVNVLTRHGPANKRPAGCTYHHFENLELWTESTGVCTFGAGCLCRVTTAPTEDKPTQNKPTEDKPTENKPTENKPTEDKPTQNIVRHTCGTSGKQSTGTVLTTLPLGFEESEQTACDCRSACQRESRCYSWDYRALGKQSECTLRSGQILEESSDVHLVAGLSDVFSFVPGKEGFKKCAEKGQKCSCVGFARFGGEISKGQFAFTPAHLIDSDVQCEQNNFPVKMINKFGKKPFCECKHSELSGKFEIPSTSEMYGFFATDEQKDKMSEEKLQQILQSTAPLHAGLAEFPLGVFHALEFPAVEMGIKSAKSCDAMKKPEFQNSGSPFLCGAPAGLDLGAVIDGLEHVGLGMASGALRKLVGDDKSLGTDLLGVADMCMGSFNMKSPAHRLMDTKCRTDIFDERNVAGTFSTHINVGLFGVNLCATVDPCDGGFYVQMENDWIAKNFVGMPKSIAELVITGVGYGSELGFGVSPSKNFKREVTYWTGNSLHEERITEIYNGRFALNFQMDLGEGIQGLIQHMIKNAAKTVAKDAAGIDSSSWSGWMKEKAVTGTAGWAATTTASKFAEKRGWPILNDAFGTSKAEIMLGLDFIDELVSPDFGKWFEDRSEGSAFEKIMWLVAQNSALITAEADFELNFKQLTRGKLDYVLGLADAKVQLLADGVNQKIHFAAHVRSSLIRELCNMVVSLWPNMGDLGKADNEKSTFQRSKGKNSYQCPEWLKNFDFDAKIDVLLKMVGDADDTFQVGFRVDIENEHVKKHFKGSKMESCLEMEFACNMFFNKREPFVMRCNIFGNGVGTNDKGAAYQITETAEVGESDVVRQVIDKFGECGTGVQEIMNKWLIRKPVGKIKAIFAGANKALDHFLEDIGDGANYLQMVGARDDNGFVYALGVGMEKTGEFLTMVKGMHDEAATKIIKACDKAFDTAEARCEAQEEHHLQQCNQCQNKARKCEQKLKEAHSSCKRNMDICNTCRKTCKNIGVAACKTGNWIHEEAAANTLYARDVAWCGTQKAANAMCWWCRHTFDFDGCKRRAWSEKVRRERKHQAGYQRCLKDKERECREDGHCWLVEKLFENGKGECSQLCNIGVGKVMRDLSCNKIGKNVCTIGNCGARWFTAGFCDTLESFGEICEKDERIKKRLRRQMLEDFRA